MIYELWDGESGNLVGAYEAVPEIIDLHGRSFTDALALVRDDDEADVETLSPPPPS